MKDIFSYNADVNKTAYMNWRTSHHDHIYNMIVIADGFMNSAILLAEAALVDNWDKKEDSFIYQIIQTVIKRVQEFETDKEKRKQFNNMINGTKFYVDELFEKIATQNGKRKKDNMDFSRYPFEQKYMPHFYITEFENVVVDLENFVQRFKEIGENLRLISTYYLFDILEAEE